MNAIKKIILVVYTLFSVFVGNAQDISIAGSCITSSTSLVLGGDVTNTTYNGKPVYYNAAVNINFQGNAITTEAYLYYELAAVLSTPENRWVISFDGQPIYYFISNSNTAPTGQYLPFDTAAPTSECGGLTTSTLLCTAPVVPTFTEVAPICSGATLSSLPTTSNNGITGTWSPALNNTATTVYTFTPNVGQCATTSTLIITVNSLPNVAFTTNPSTVCTGTSATLTSNVTNAAPTVSTGSQTFNMITASFGTPITMPLTGVLALAPSDGCSPFAPGLFNGKIALIQRGGCAFNIKAELAQDAGAIGVIFYNDVPGILNLNEPPGIIIPVYGVTQADGQALIAAMTSNEVNVTLTPAPPLTYLWGNGNTSETINTGVLNADTSFSVTATNIETGCLSTVSVTVPVTPNRTPTFTQLAAICSGDAFTLPSTSNNGIIGTWSPALNNTTTTVYTFTPNGGQCSGTSSMTVTVNLPTTTGSVTTTACSSYTWPANGVTYTTNQSGVTVVTGCNTATLNLTITGSPIDYANLQFPFIATLCQGQSFMAYGRVYEPGITDASQTLQGAGIDVEFGYSITNSNPNTWTNWTPATYNASSICYPCNDDEYEFSAGADLLPGRYYYLFRFKRSECSTWQYGGYPNGLWNGTTQNSGELTVNAQPTITGDAIQTFSVANLADATLASLVVSPTNVIWYSSQANAEAGTNALPSTTVLTNGATYYAVASTSNCSSAAFAVTVTVTLGNDEFDTANFRYYPSPTSSELTISYSKEISEVAVFNLLGQVLLTQKTNATQVQLDLSRLAAAAYFVKVTADGKTKTVKVVKQ